MSPRLALILYPNISHCKHCYSKKSKKPYPATSSHTFRRGGQHARLADAGYASEGNHEFRFRLSSRTCYAVDGKLDFWPTGTTTFDIACLVWHANTVQNVVHAQDSHASEYQYMLQIIIRIPQITRCILQNNPMYPPNNQRNLANDINEPHIPRTSPRLAWEPCRTRCRRIFLRIQRGHKRATL